MKLIAISSSSTSPTSATLAQSVLNRDYCDAFMRDGFCPIILPTFPISNREALTQEEFEDMHEERLTMIADRCAAYVASGGVDLNPASFGDVNTSSFSCDSERDMMERATLTAFINAGKPILGICRGFQLAARALSLGHFQQDINVSGEAHTGIPEPYLFKWRQEPMHTVDVFGEYRDFLREHTKRDTLNSMKTNSMHHQALTLTVDGKPSGQKVIKYTDPEYHEKFAAWRQQLIEEYEMTYDIDILAATPLVIEAYERESIKLVAFQNHVESSGPTSLGISYWIDKYLTD